MTNKIKSIKPTNERNFYEKIKTVDFMLENTEKELNELKNTNMINLLQTNIINITPNIIHDWEEMKKNNKITIFELMDYCEFWVNTITINILTNKDSIRKNKKLNDHIIKCLDICKTIMIIMHKHYLSN